MILPNLQFWHLPRTRLIRYSVAIVSVIVALLLTLLIQPLIPEPDGSSKAAISRVKSSILIFSKMVIC